MQLDLLSWNPPTRILTFPLKKRVGKIRAVAEKMLAKPTERAAEAYRNQVTDALLRQLARTGVPEAEQDEELGAFWEAVRVEILRRCYANRDSGGAA